MDETLATASSRTPVPAFHIASPISVCTTPQVCSATSSRTASLGPGLAVARGQLPRGSPLRHRGLSEMKARFRNTLALARLEVGRSIWSTMRRRLSERMEAVATASRILVEQYRTFVASERAVAERSDQSEPAGGPAHDVSLSVVHYRGGREELDLGLEYARSADPLDRVVGADVLAQLGWNDREFLDESVEALIALLDDPDPSVVERAAFGLGPLG
jgi:hypothetical protein